MLRWLVAFAFTQLVEAPLYAHALGVDGPRRSGRGRVLWALLPSLLTHPVVWFLIPLAGRALGMRYVATVVVAEVFAVVVEAAILHRAGLGRAFRWSLFANATSACLGLLSRSVFGWP